MVIINIQQKDFGGRLRSGDILGICNVLEHMRQVDKSSNIKFFLPDESVDDNNYVREFREILKKHTDYFSDIPGDQYFQFERFNVWDYRSISGDLVKVDNTKYEKENIVCIFPLFDAKYNVYRNWNKSVTNTVIDYFKKYHSDCRIIICAHESQKNLIENEFPGLEYSYNYINNIEYILKCKYFAGGDTGTSHLAGSLINRPKNLFLYAAEELFHTFPLNFKEGEMIMYSQFGCNINVR